MIACQLKLRILLFYILICFHHYALTTTKKKNRKPLLAAHPCQVMKQVSRSNPFRKMRIGKFITRLDDRHTIRMDYISRKNACLEAIILVKVINAFAIHGKNQLRQG